MGRRAAAGILTISYYNIADTVSDLVEPTIVAYERVAARPVWFDGYFVKSDAVAQFICGGIEYLGLERLSGWI